MSADLSIAIPISFVIASLPSTKSMTIKLLDAISRFAAVNDRETDTAYFRTHVPWLAPLAYLNIIFKAPDRSDLIKASLDLRLPPLVADFFSLQNGAILFSGAMCIYGIVPKQRLLNRSDPFNRLPFDIAHENNRWLGHDAERFLVVGSYDYDSSRVCVDRRDFTVHSFKTEQRTLATTPSYSWQGFEQWLTEETSRLAMLFDRDGRLLVDKSQTLPKKLHLN
jgi:hypothetical protein